MIESGWITPSDIRFDSPPKRDLGYRHPTWWMRRTVTLDAVPDSAELGIVCLGYYELYVNGHRAGAEPLAPSISKLDHRGLRIVHDIASFLCEGQNTIGIWCSSGWYLPNQFTVHDGWTPLLRLDIPSPPAHDTGLAGLLSGADWRCRESNRTIVGTWEWNLFGGEEVDARDYVAEWNTVDCDEAGWRPARDVTAPPIIVTDRTCPPNRVGEIYPARAVRRIGDCRFEVDFGTCLAGWVTVQFRNLAPGQTVTLRFLDLPADNDRNKDHSYHQVSFYHAAGNGDDVFENKFNYAGFRYVVLEGIDTCPVETDMEALLVESAMDPVGTFSCSNDLFNHIHDLNVHTLRCLDLGGYSVDCPHRERNGYGADGQAVLPAYLYTLDCAAFLRKWLTDWCDVQDPETGRIPHCAPTRHHQDSPAWGGIVAPLAWRLWLFHKDRGALEEAFPVIRKYLDYLMAAVHDGILRRDGRDWLFLGDWVAAGRGMDSGNEPDTAMRELVNTCYLVYLWQIYSRIAAVLSEDGDTARAADDTPALNRARSALVHGEVAPPGGPGSVRAAEHIEALRTAIHREFWDPEQECYLLPEQTYQVMPLSVGAVPAELWERVHARLIDMILTDRKGHIDTGITGTTFLFEYLERTGCNDVIAAVLSREDQPGWGHMCASGATAIWEQWNGYWSQIHSTFSGVASWFYSGLAGIRPDPEAPGFESVLLRPAFPPGLDFVKCTYTSMRGRIGSSWRREDNVVHWSIEVPTGSRAVVHLPEHVPGSLQVDGVACPAPSEPVSLGDGSHELCWRADSRQDQSNG